MISSIHPVRRVMAGVQLRGRFGKGPLHHRRRYFRRVLQDQSASGVAGYPDSLPAVPRPTRWAKAAFLFRVQRFCLPVAPGRVALRFESRAPDRGGRRKFRINYLAPETDRAGLYRGPQGIAQDLERTGGQALWRRGRSGSKDFQADEELLSFCRQTGSTVIIRHRPAGWERSARGGRSAASPSRDRGLRAWSMHLSCPT